MAEAGSEPTPEGGTGGGGEPAPAAQSFTQQQVNDLLAREKGKLERKFGDYAELKDKASKLDQLEESKKTETEKLLAAVEKAGRTAEEATTREQAATEREKQAHEHANSLLVRSAVVSEAAKQSAVDPDDVFGLLDKAKVTISDDGTVTGAQEAVKDLLKAKPHLVGRTGGNFGGGAQGAPASGPDMNDLIRQQAGFSLKQ